MGAIQDFLAQIGDTIVSVWQFALSWIKDWVGVLKLLTQIPHYIKVSVSWLPNELLVLFTLLLSVIIVYKIVGREG